MSIFLDIFSGEGSHSSDSRVGVASLISLNDVQFTAHAFHGTCIEFAEPFSTTYSSPVSSIAE